MDSNARAKAENRTAINLQSVLIGNGMTDVGTMIPAYYELLCTPASVEPPVDIATCVATKAAVGFLFFFTPGSFQDLHLTIVRPASKMPEVVPEGVC